MHTYVGIDDMYSPSLFLLFALKKDTEINFQNKLSQRTHTFLETVDADFQEMPPPSFKLRLAVAQGKLLGSKKDPSKLSSYLPKIL